jgi:hypothetical protein
MARASGCPAPSGCLVPPKSAGPKGTACFLGKIWLTRCPPGSRLLAHVRSERPGIFPGFKVPFHVVPREVFGDGRVALKRTNPHALASDEDPDQRPPVGGPHAPRREAMAGGRCHRSYDDLIGQVFVWVDPMMFAIRFRIHPFLTFTPFSRGQIVTEQEPMPVKFHK